MFEWKVEDMILMKDNYMLGKEKHYLCEQKVSREDKIAFVDKMLDGKLSYILSLIEKFQEDADSMPKDQYGYVKTVSLKAWVRKNDTKYPRPIIDNNYSYGNYNLLGCSRNIGINYKGTWDTYEDLVDEVFYRQLKKCEVEEIEYFEEHDEYSILKKRLRKQIGTYNVYFGLNIGFSSDNNIYIYSENGKDKRKINIDEIKELLSKYDQLDALVGEIMNEINITY